MVAKSAILIKVRCKENIWIRAFPHLDPGAPLLPALSRDLLRSTILLPLAPVLMGDHLISLGGAE